MSTSDQQGNGPLTRKQLREIRATGATPVISSEAAAAAAEQAPPAPAAPAPAAPAATTPAATDDESGEARLTRREARQRQRTGPTTLVESEDGEAESHLEESEALVAASVSADAVARSVPAASASSAPVIPAPPAPRIVSEPSVNEESGDADDLDVPDTNEFAIPVSASHTTEASDDVSIVPAASEQPEVLADPADGQVARSDDAVAAVAELGIDAASDAQASEVDAADEDDVLADVRAATQKGDAGDEHPTVSSTFGQELLQEAAVEPQAPFTPSFDELLTVGDSGGSRHSAPNTLIFTPQPGDGSLSGPVASTGEVLVTGSYELPQGLGSQGHAIGTTDGREVDAVLIDGELPPASSPTPIAASAAISTIKPAGEVIRPPVPEKGNRLMLILAIVAGGLALAVGVAVIIAVTGNVFN